MLPKWSDDYSIGNELIDNQHKYLFELANELETIRDRSISRAKLKGLLKGCFHYMREHFRTEEKYMKNIGYPELDIHKQLHREIVLNMAHLILTVKTTNDLKERFYLIVKRWLLGHTMYEDMKIAEFTKAQAKMGSESAKDISYVDESVGYGGYIYACGCEGKNHSVSYDVHLQIQSAIKDVRCRVCDETITFVSKEEVAM